MRTQPNEVKGRALHTAQAGNANGDEIDVGERREGGYVSVGVQAVGTFTGTLNFEGTIDNATWFAVEGQSYADSADLATTATVAGAWYFRTLGLSKFRVRTSGMSAGSVTVTARAFS